MPPGTGRDSCSQRQQERKGARKRESRKDVGRTWRGRDVERGRDRRKNEGKGEGKGQKI